MAEDADLVAELDALEVHKGPPKLTCIWWQAQSEPVIEAAIRNSKAKGHTRVAARLRELGERLTAPDIKLHAEGKCKCQTSPQS